MVERKTWKDFQQSKMLWWINRILHTFGWAIVLDVGEEGEILDAYPARVKFRGFSETSETNGFIGLTEHIKENIESLVEETKM